MKRYSALIIGGGSIGALKPDKYDHPGGENILTMAHAFSRNDRIDFIGVVDSDESKAQKIINKWDCAVWTDIDSAYKDLQDSENLPDIISLCIPTEKHYDFIDTLYKKYESGEWVKPKIFICEKPFCDTLHRAVVTDAKFQLLGIQCVVNYSRMFLPEYKNIELEYPVYSCALHYTRGTLHEACHALALFNSWFGKNISATIINRELSMIIDRDEKDPSYMVHLDYEKCHNVLMIPVDGNDFSVFDIQILDHTKAISLYGHGKVKKIRPVIQEPVYGEYKSLASYIKNEVDTRLSVSLSYLVENVVLALDTGQVADCTSLDAIAVHEVYKKIIAGVEK